ncbi:MAG: IPExxxVDY family protein [Bacteroidetes bacterium]|nr:IPExxxVDY family protein [Bacteroidota bacterium]
MAKHTLEIEFDYDFVLIGISSHEKDYRLCWTVNNALNLQLSKQESLEIKGRKQTTPSFFSFFLFEKQDEFIDYAIIANLSESKTVEQTTSTLFDALDESDNEYLIPEQKQMNYFFLIRGEIENEEVNEIIQQIKEIENVQTAVRIDVKSLRSKQNLIF